MTATGIWPPPSGASRLGTLPYCFCINAGSFRLPSGIWTTVPLTGANEADTDNMHPASGNVAFTLNSSMNTLALPQANIQVNESLASLPIAPTAANPAFLLVTSTDGSPAFQVIKVTGVNTGTNTFTGCSGGTGTLATNGACKLANQSIVFNHAGLYTAIACVTFPSIPINNVSTAWAAAYSQANAGTSVVVGQIGVRITSGGSFDFPIGTDMFDLTSQNNLVIPSHTLSTAAQPLAPTVGGPPTNDYRVECFQNVVAGMTIAVDAIQAPTFGLAYVSNP